MRTLLHIDASARTTRSITRHLTATFIKAWNDVRPADQVIRRDLAQDPPPFVSQDWIAAAFRPKEKRDDSQLAVLSVSETYIDELRRADVIVLGTPMYNYGMPAALKAWVDQVVRVNETFSFDLARGEWPLKPILQGKTLVVLTSRGEFGFEPGGVREHMNYLDGHIDIIAHYLGAEHIHKIAVDYQEFGDERHDASLRLAEAKAQELSRDLASGNTPV